MDTPTRDHAFPIDFAAAFFDLDEVEVDIGAGAHGGVEVAMEATEPERRGTALHDPDGFGSDDEDDGDGGGRRPSVMQPTFEEIWGLDLLGDAEGGGDGGDAAVGPVAARSTRYECGFSVCMC